MKTKYALVVDNHFHRQRMKFELVFLLKVDFLIYIITHNLMNSKIKSEKYNHLPSGETYE